MFVTLKNIYGCFRVPFSVSVDVRFQAWQSSLSNAITKQEYDLAWLSSGQFTGNTYYTNSLYALPSQVVPVTQPDGSTVDFVITDAGYLSSNLSDWVILSTEVLKCPVQPRGSYQP